MGLRSYSFFKEVLWSLEVWRLVWLLSIKSAVQWVLLIVLKWIRLKRERPYTRDDSCAHFREDLGYLRIIYLGDLVSFSESDLRSKHVRAKTLKEIREMLAEISRQEEIHLELGMNTRDWKRPA